MTSETGAWDAVRARYAVGDIVPALVGSSKMRVESLDCEDLCLSQRLWSACVGRADVEEAVRLLAALPECRSAVAFSEFLRGHYATRRAAETGCLRRPNLCAVVLRDLGLLYPTR